MMKVSFSAEWRTHCVVIGWLINHITVNYKDVRAALESALHASQWL